jgi:protein-S-isoprenylcysteine O-methyltransferase Ste14
LYGPLKSFEHTKVYDVAAVTPLIGFHGWWLSRDLPILARMPFEERVLADAFPAYTEYSARTARLIPGIY